MFSIESEPFDNGQAESGAFLGDAASPNKRLEDFHKVRFWNARSIILDLKYGAGFLAVNADIDPAALRNVTDGIVDQIANHDRKHRGLAPDEYWFDNCKSKVDTA